MSRNSGSDDSATREALVLPLSWHRVVFSYLGCPTAVIAVAFSLLILVASTLPLAAVTGCWYLLCDTVETSTVALAGKFALAAIIPVGATIVLLIPGASLLARSYGRVVRSLTYLLFGVFTAIVLLTYSVFYWQYTPGTWDLWNKIKQFTLYFPFYFILAGALVFIVTGILEWLRRPTLLFRPYVLPVSKPLKPTIVSRLKPKLSRLEQMPVPEVALNCPQCGRQLPLEATFCDKCGARITRR